MDTLRPHVREDVGPLFKQTVITCKPPELDLLLPGAPAGI